MLLLNVKTYTQILGRVGGGGGLLGKQTMKKRHCNVFVTANLNSNIHNVLQSDKIGFDRLPPNHDPNHSLSHCQLHLLPQK